MARPNYLEQIRNRIAHAKPGEVFIPSDFFDIAEAVKISDTKEPEKIKELRERSLKLCEKYPLYKD